MKCGGDGPQAKRWRPGAAVPRSDGAVGDDDAFGVADWFCCERTAVGAIGPMGQRCLAAPNARSLAMFGLGTWDLLIVAVVVLLLFGNRLPSVMRSLGRGVVEFKKGVRGIEEDIESGSNENKTTPTT